MPLVVDLRGFPELAAKLHALGNAISEDILEAAVKAGAKIARDAAAVKAPRSTHADEHLADHITVQTVEKDGVHAVASVGPQGWGPKGEGRWFFWRFLEYGTSKMDPQPTSQGFLRPAIDENEDAITRAIAQRIGVEIEKVIR